MLGIIHLALTEQPHKGSVFRLAPRLSQIAIELQRFEDTFDLLIADQLCREHFLEQLMAMPDSNVEVLSELVHAQVIRDHNGVSDLAKRQHSAVCRRRRRAARRGIGRRIH